MIDKLTPCCELWLGHRLIPRRKQNIHCKAKQVAQLSQRDRAAGWVSYGQKWKTGTGRQPLWRIWPAKQSNSVKKTQKRAITPYEHCQRQSCKTFIGLTIRAKMIGRGNSFHLKFWVNLTALERSHCQYIFARSASVVSPSPSEKKFN